MTLKPGQFLQSRYRIDALLGQGGMAAVYRAWDTRLNVAVALKEMAPQPGLDPATLAQLRAQFQQEASILAHLSHPHLVRVTDFFEEGGNVYLVMDFVEGESLAALIERRGALPEGEVLTWAGQLLDALGYCHAQGVLHRDVKPQNVIIRPDGRAVLVDFGLVKLWDPGDPRTKTAMRGMGTPEYAPPEQYGTQPGHTDPRSDLYSLGATLYHALTGQAPVTATLRMADPQQFKRPRHLVFRISERTEAAILKALELPCAQRWQSAAEMAQALGVRAPAWDSGVAVRSALPVRTGTKLMPGAAAPVASAPAVAVPAVGPVPRRRRMPAWVWALIAMGGVAVVVMVAVFICSTAAPLLLLFTEGGQQLPAGGQQSPGGGNVTIIMHNNSGQTVVYAYVSPCSDTTWGDDDLGSATVPDSGTFTFQVPAGCYDLRAEGSGNTLIETEMGVNVSGTYDWYVTSSGQQSPGGGNATIVMHNNSGQTVCYVYISPSSETTWGEDQLGATETIANGGNRTFTVSAGTYDLRAEDCSHNALDEEWNVNINGLYTWSVP